MSSTQSGDPKPRFAGRVGLVTGGARGIGRAIAVRLAADGAAVLIADLDGDMAADAAAAIVASGGRATGMRVDATDRNDTWAMATAANETFGGIDLLVNNAGILRSTRVMDISADEWDLVIDANLRSTFLCSQAVQPSMVARGGGRIVNVASMAGRATSTLGGAHYTAAKAGVLGLTRHLAREWAPVGITVNAISPGIVDTPMVRQGIDPDGLERIRLGIPLQRLADPAEVAALVGFLLSDEAAYITGANVDIHGGELIIA